MTAPVPTDAATVAADLAKLTSDYATLQDDYVAQGEQLATATSQLAATSSELAAEQATNGKLTSQITGAGYALPDGVTITPPLASPTDPELQAAIAQLAAAGYRLAAAAPYAITPALVSPAAPPLPTPTPAPVLTVLRGAHSNASRSGIPPATSIAYLKQIGATVHRMDYRLCESVPTSAGVYSTSFDSTVDTLVTDAIAAQIDTVLCLWGNPPWASGFSSVPSGAPQGASVPGCWPAPGSAQEATLIAAWVAMATRAAARYKGKVKKWELGNEEAQGFCWWIPNPAQFAKWFSAVRAAIKAVDPTNVVVIGGLNGVGAGPVYSYGSNSAQFLSQVYAALKAANMPLPDGAAIHSYGPAQTALVPGGDSYGDIATIRSIMAQNGQDPAAGQAVLWVTETGNTATPTDVTNELALLKSAFPYVSLWCWFLLANNPANPNDKWPGAMFNTPGQPQGITPVGTAFLQAA